MILTCPSCAARYQVDAAKFPAVGRQVRCAKCGHVWHQPGAAPELESFLAPEPVMAAPEPEPAPEFAPEIAAEVALGPMPEAPRMRPAPSYYAPLDERPAMGWASRLAIVAGWAGLIGVVLLIGLSAVRYRQEISTLWPQSAGVYDRLGMNVNAHGVDFTKVDYRRESEDGQVVLAVTGQIVNNGTRELPVPATVRVTLSDAANHELYHWDFPSTAQTLKSGQSVAFSTRLSSPPAAARHLEVRFAKEGQ
jgi:predicted Zn finger-like uncharacterized protein